MGHPVYRLILYLFLPKRIPKIIIKKNNKEDQADIKEYVTHYLTKEKTILTKNISINKDKDELVITCMNEESVEDAEKILKKKLATHFKITKEQLLKPKLKLVGIENCLKLDAAGLSGKYKTPDDEVERRKMLDTWNRISKIENTEQGLLDKIGENLEKMN
ncbi:hypothetical protein TSAR_007307 [Trichomalopsis sarcophagae]|uniref:Uncharacterized protein n=1 Tax=Trichomalopsis sarcophagae TaxID=543379 RepID=A0A232FJ99_9HYME|nr:hypothetical protein TSAR_007307 [Trichomalopsis sarcophagae]